MLIEIKNGFECLPVCLDNSMFSETAITNEDVKNKPPASDLGIVSQGVAIELG